MSEHLFIEDMMTSPTESTSRKAPYFEEYEESKLSVQKSDQKEVNQWAMLLHLSQFAGFVVPFAGFVVPILIWLLKKEELPEIDAHGKMVANWLITEIILGVGLMIFVLVGIIVFPLLVCITPLAIGLSLAGLIFPIMGAIKASNGELWSYPFTFRLLK